jgi:hypothetical protein
MIFDMLEMYRMTCGWMYESFLLYRSVKENVRYAAFDFLDLVPPLLDLTADDTRFSFSYIKTSDSECLSLFRLFRDHQSMVKFRRVLSRFNLSQQHILISFMASQLRWSFTTVPRRTCPLCFVGSWRWEHFFNCPVIVPVLSTRSISIDCFRHHFSTDNWRSVFSTIPELLLVWHFALLQSQLPHFQQQYDPDVIRSVLRDALTI